MKNQKQNIFLIFLSGAVLTLIFAGFVLFKTPKTQITDQQTVNLSHQSSSDETSELEKDVLGTDLSDIDKELEQIESELFGI